MRREPEALPLTSSSRLDIPRAAARLAVKMPMFRCTPGSGCDFEAPTGGSVILAAIMLKRVPTASCASACPLRRRESRVTCW